MSPPPEAIDWGVAARIATAVAGPGPSVPPADRAALRRDFQEFTAASHDLVRGYTGLEPPAPPGRPTVLDRSGWVRLNVDTFRTVLSPIGDKLRRVGGVGRRIAGAALGAQLGLVLGYVSKKVLGQYDLFLAPGGGGAVYYVGPNIVAAERRAALEPRDFRLWIALHEVTHRTQFAAVPWLRDHVVGLVGRYLSSVELDAERLKRAAEQARKMLLEGGKLGRMGIVQLLLTPEQRGVLERMQALMCVVEGHGNFVMDGIGAERIPTYDRMKGALARRRDEGSLAQKAFEKAIGIDLKYQQYSLGQGFLSAVAERAGMQGVNRVWEREENLPTLAEISDPGAWLVRVGAS